MKKVVVVMDAHANLRQSHLKLLPGRRTTRQVLVNALTEKWVLDDDGLTGPSYVVRFVLLA